MWDYPLICPFMSHNLFSGITPWNITTKCCKNKLMEVHWSNIEARAPSSGLERKMQVTEPLSLGTGLICFRVLGGLRGLGWLITGIFHTSYLVYYYEMLWAMCTFCIIYIQNLWPPFKSFLYNLRFVLTCHNHNNRDKSQNDAILIYTYCRVEVYVFNLLDYWFTSIFKTKYHLLKKYTFKNSVIFNRI